MQDLQLSLGSKLAGEALAAAFVLEKMRQPHQHVTQINRVIKDHNRARAESATDSPQILERQPYVQLVRA